MTTHLTTEDLIDYIHGELPFAEDAITYAHLTACSRCRLELEHETALTDILRRGAAQGELALPPAVKAAIRRAAAREAKPATLLRMVAVALPIAAAIAIGVVATGPLTHRGSLAAPSVDVSFYFDQHAAQQAPNPLAERSMTPQTSETTHEHGVSEAPDLTAHQSAAAGFIDAEN